MYTLDITLIGDWWEIASLFHLLSQTLSYDEFFRQRSQVYNYGYMLKFKTFIIEVKLFP